MYPRSGVLWCALLLCLCAVSPALAIDPLPIDTRLIQYLDVPVDGQHGTTVLFGYNTRQTALVSIPNTFTPQTFLVTPTLDATRLACPDAETTTNGQAINRRGDIVGYCLHEGLIQGFLLRARRHHDPFTFLLPKDAIESQAIGLNDARQVVGTYRDGALRLHGLLRREGRLVTVDAPWASDTVLTGINNHGQIVGYAYDQFGTPHGLLGTLTRTDVVLEVLDVPDTFLTLLLGLNDDGDVVGFTVLADGTPTSVVRLAWTWYTVQLPNPKAIFTDVTGISHTGHLIGRMLLDNFPDPVQGVVSRGFVLTPPQPGLTPAGVQAVQALAQAQRAEGSPPLQVTLTGCEDLTAGQVRPAKLVACR